MPRLILEAVQAHNPPHDEEATSHLTIVSITREDGQPVSAQDVHFTVRTLLKPSNASEVTTTQNLQTFEGYYQVPLDPGPNHWQKGHYVLGLIANWTQPGEPGPNNLPTFTFHHGQTILRFQVT